MTSRKRLNQNPGNSSRPSGSLASWDKGLFNAADGSHPDTDEESALASAIDNKEEE